MEDLVDFHACIPSMTIYWTLLCARLGAKALPKYWAYQDEKERLILSSRKLHFLDISMSMEETYASNSLTILSLACKYLPHWNPFIREELVKIHGPSLFPSSGPSSGWFQHWPGYCMQPLSSLTSGFISMEIHTYPTHTSGTYSNGHILDLINHLDLFHLNYFFLCLPWTVSLLILHPPK